MKVKRKRTRNGTHTLHSLDQQSLDLMEDMAAEEEPQLLMMDPDNRQRHLVVMRY